MKKLYAELANKGSYITENYNDKQFEEILEISKDNLLIPLEYKDQMMPKNTNLKLVVFQNEYIYSRFDKWITNHTIAGIKTIEKFHYFREHHSINNTFIGLFTPKTEYNYFMGENRNLILEKMHKISTFLKVERDSNLQVNKIFEENNHSLEELIANLV